MLAQNSVGLEHSSGAEQRIPEDVVFESCITKNELARTLGVSISLINRLMAEGEIPYLKLGRSVRFQTKDIFAWFQRRKLQS